MFKSRNKKTIIYIVVPIILVLVGLLGIKSYSSSKNYKNLIAVANEYMYKKDYDKAIEKFKESLDYKKDPKIQEKIEECDNKLIEISKESLKDKEYEKAEEHLNVLIKHNEKNEEVMKIKSVIKDEIQKDKEEKIKKDIEEARIKQDERKQKDEEENKKGQVKKSNKITKEEAENLVKPLKKKDQEIRYLGINQVPEIPKESVPYERFPKEIENKQVYIFEILAVYGGGNKEAIGRYYVAFSGNIYKDTYPSNLQCVKIK